MLPIIYTQPAAASLFLGICLIWLVPEMIGMRRQMARASGKADSIQDRGSLAVLLGLQWTGLALNFLLAWLVPTAAMRWQREALFLVGLAQKIAEFRDAHHLKQAELAAKLHVSQQFISQLETGRSKNLTLQTLMKVAASLGRNVQISFPKSLRPSLKVL